MTKLSIRILKRDAKRIQDTTGCTHATALDRVAQGHGYDNWSLLHKHLGHDRPLTPEDMIRKAMDDDPYLTAFGYGIFRDHNRTLEEANAEFDKERAAMLSPHSVEEFERACEWLSQVTRTKHPNPRVGSSYSLKHSVEAYWKRRRPGMDNYVSNGMFIAAAMHLGFIVKPITQSPNAWVNIAKAGFPI